MHTPPLNSRKKAGVANAPLGRLRGVCNLSATYFLIYYAFFAVVAALPAFQARARSACYESGLAHGQGKKEKRFAQGQSAAGGAMVATRGS